MATWPVLSVTTFLPLLGALFIMALRGDTESVKRNARWVAAKPLQSLPLRKPKFLTVVSFSRVACAAFGGFGRDRATATALDIFYRLQVTNFGLLKSAPNGLNYMDIRRLFLHGPLQITGRTITRKYLFALSIKKGDI